MLMKAVIKYGKDYKKISTVLKNKTRIQVRMKVLYMIRQIASNPQHENSKYANILKKIPPCTVKHVWTDQQKKKFNAALQKYGCFYREIMKYFPTMSYKQIMDHAFSLRNAIKRDKNHPDAHLKKILEAGVPNLHWT